MTVFLMSTAEPGSRRARVFSCRVPGLHYMSVFSCLFFVWSCCVQGACLCSRIAGIKAKFANIKKTFVSQITPTLRKTRTKVYIILHSLFKCTTQNLHCIQQDLPLTVNTGQWRGNSWKSWEWLYKYYLPYWFQSTIMKIKGAKFVKGKAIPVTGRAGP
jgi:hypothetical protein